MKKIKASRQDPPVGESLRREWDGAHRYLDMANAIFLVLNADQTVALINRYGCKVLGRTESQVVGRNWIDTFLPERDRPRVRSVFVELMAGKMSAAESYENPILAAGGRERLIAWRNAVLRNEKGRIIGLVSCGTDTTERRQAENKQAESEKRYRQLVEKMNEGVVAIDAERRITFVNDRFCEMVGYRREELLGHSQAIYHNRANQRVMRERLAQRRKGEAGQYEVDFLRKDGRTIVGLVSPTPLFGPDGQFQGSVAVVLDITARKEAEEALRENELLFRRLFEANVIGVISGEGEVITQANDRFLKMVGYTRADLKAGKVNWRKMTPPEYSAIDRVHVREMLATGIDSTYEKEYIRKDEIGRAHV